MSPELRKGGDLILDVPDKSGTYPTPYGDLNINMDLLSPSNKQVVLSGASFLYDRFGSNKARVLQLSKDGVGVQMLKDGEPLVFYLKDASVVKKPEKPGWKQEWKAKRAQRFHY